MNSNVVCFNKLKTTCTLLQSAHVSRQNTQRPFFQNAIIKEWVSGMLKLRKNLSPFFPLFSLFFVGSWNFIHQNVRLFISNFLLRGYSLGPIDRLAVFATRKYEISTFSMFHLSLTLLLSPYHHISNFIICVFSHNPNPAPTKCWVSLFFKCHHKKKSVWYVKIT